MIIDGKKIALEIQEEIKNRIKDLPRKPGLVFILVGEDPASHIYVGMKKKACARVGIKSKVYELPVDVTEKELLATIHKENANSDTDGILVQMPLPDQIKTRRVIDAIDPFKDVDGFHPVNVGKMLLGYEDGFLPCTPLGILELLEQSNIDPAGKHTVILGRSNIVGKPMAALLLQKKKRANATVTIAHSGTKNLSQITRTADILISAMGSPKFIKKKMVKENAVVIDVGISRLGKGISGDVDFDEVAPICSHITPVPGGVGPMTITMLLQNTLKSYLNKQ